jgi:hypothetical protein
MAADRNAAGAMRRAGGCFPGPEGAPFQWAEISAPARCADNRGNSVTGLWGMTRRKRPRPTGETGGAEVSPHRGKVAAENEFEQAMLTRTPRFMLYREPRRRPAGLAEREGLQFVIGL